MRIGPNDLVTNDAELLRKMWAVRSPYRKGPFYQAVRFDPTKDNLISMRDDEAHNTLRAKMATGVSLLVSLLLMSCPAQPVVHWWLSPLSTFPYDGRWSWRAYTNQYVH